jgi:integrase
MHDVCKGGHVAWKQNGHPTVQMHRDKWVVRVDGIDTETGRRRPRQVGTYRSRRSAQAAAAAFTASGEVAAERETVAHLVDEWVAGKVDVSNKTRLQYEWAAGHIGAGIGGVRVDRLDRTDVSGWFDQLASEGKFSRRSIQIMRMVLRAALADAVEIGELRRSPASRVGMPRAIAKTERQRDVEAWTEDELQRFLVNTRDHRWGPPLRLSVLYGLRRSELLGLTWSAVDLKRGSVRIKQALIEVHGRPEWSEGKNTRSRRTIPIDRSTVAALKEHHRFQNEERLAAGHRWNDFDLVVATRVGRPVSPGNFDQTLERLVKTAGVRRLTSHGLRHTAATHMVRHAADIGEIRAAADLLGHSPDMLMRTYARALPESIRTVTDRIEQSARGVDR